MFAFARGGKNNTRAFDFYNMKLHDNFGCSCRQSPKIEHLKVVKLKLFLKSLVCVANTRFCSKRAF